MRAPPTARSVYPRAGSSTCGCRTSTSMQLRRRSSSTPSRATDPFAWDTHSPNRSAETILLTIAKEFSSDDHIEDGPKAVIMIHTKRSSRASSRSPESPQRTVPRRHPVPNVNYIFEGVGGCCRSASNFTSAAYSSRRLSTNSVFSRPS